ncbi:uncharacterized protein PFL1_03887 [Pseudozyma flocculosa PF-1]|uniref:Uncharacterized protein n=2 Tax=Pseudozyma flocculosa TaxID=84751 RepID=A0A5C3EWT1_9BASI|nr:uncharacterized protein PFL1_03887 [Pseudozyma flocculosa PF-1]EPQ28583.1 hypothetical protein PFL1_03887 [Pseudozyma flocculosa PF-1]SPO36522.1 uncharacterized protein PSFLO_01993 [Pseudozyma flocculosa]
MKFFGTFLFLTASVTTLVNGAWMEARLADGAKLDISLTPENKVRLCTDRSWQFRNKDLSWQYGLAYGKKHHKYHFAAKWKHNLLVEVPHLKYTVCFEDPTPGRTKEDLESLAHLLNDPNNNRKGKGGPIAIYIDTKGREHYTEIGQFSPLTD